MIFLVLAGSLGTAPAGAEAAQNCTLTRAGEVYCDGSAQPVRVRVTGKVVQLAASGDSTCALTEPGEVFCWGGHADDQAAAVPAEDDYGLSFNPLILISIGLALVGAGFTLVRIGQGAGAKPDQGARAKAGEGAGAEVDQGARVKTGEGAGADASPGAGAKEGQGAGVREGRRAGGKAGQGARPRAASRHRSAPSFSRSL